MVRFLDGFKNHWQHQGRSFNSHVDHMLNTRVAVNADVSVSLFWIKASVTLYLDSPSVDALVHGHTINKLSVDKRLLAKVTVRFRIRVRVGLILGLG